MDWRTAHIKEFEQLRDAIGNTVNPRHLAEALRRISIPTSDHPPEAVQAQMRLDEALMWLQEIPAPPPDPNWVSDTLDADPARHPAVYIGSQDGHLNDETTDHAIDLLDCAEKQLSSLDDRTDVWAARMRLSEARMWLERAPRYTTY